MHFSLDNPEAVGWQAPLAMPAEREVHLWRWSADEQFIDRASLSHLTDGEQARHARFATPQLQQRFLSAHTGLRRLLAAYLHCPVGDVSYEVSPQGKPSVARSPLQFNLSHSGDWVALAVARAAVGVDVEQLRPVTCIDSLATRYFTAAELAEFRAVDSTDQTPAFLKLWTRKEAVLKCLGVGLQSPPGELQVGMDRDAGEPIAIPASWGAQMRMCWAVTGQSTEPVVAAVAAATPIDRCRVFTVER